MHNYIYASKKHFLLNFLLVGILLISLLVYLYISLQNPKLSYIFLLFLIDFPILGYILIVNNSITFHITNDKLLIKWFGGSYEIPLNTIVGYFNYTEPLFEFHFEANFVGAKLTRNAIGEFYYFSPGIRKGLIIEFEKLSKIEKAFIVPKNKEKLIDSLRITLIEVYNKKIEIFNDRFFIK